jgi:hypothetical protein
MEPLAPVTASVSLNSGTIVIITYRTENQHWRTQVVETALSHLYPVSLPDCGSFPTFFFWFNIHWCNRKIGIVVQAVISNIRVSPLADNREQSYRTKPTT